MVYSTGRFVLSLALHYFVLVFFSPFSISITLLGEERANCSSFRTFVWFRQVWFCLFPLPIRVWDGLRLVIGNSLDFSLTFSAGINELKVCILLNIESTNFLFVWHKLIRNTIFNLDKLVTGRDIEVYTPITENTKFLHYITQHIIFEWKKLYSSMPYWCQ